MKTNCIWRFLVKLKETTYSSQNIKIMSRNTGYINMNENDISSTWDPNTYQTKWNGNLVLGYFNLLFYLGIILLHQSYLKFCYYKNGIPGSSQDTEIKSLNGALGAVLSKSTAGGFSCIQAQISSTLTKQTILLTSSTVWSESFYDLNKINAKYR